MLSSKSILKIVLLALLFIGNLDAKIFLDNDLDGVANEDDKCPNSKITDIVNKDGCAVDKVVFKKEKHIDVSIGFGQDKIDNSWQNSKNLSLAYYYGDSNFYLNLSKYSSDNSTELTVAYYHYINSLNYTITLGAGVYIPIDSSSSDKTDYFLSAKYTYFFNSSLLSAEYQHTFTKDTDTQDTNSLTVEYGYLISKKLYMALSYNYNDEDDSQAIGLYTNYHINNNWYISTNLEKELNNSSKLSYSITLGYYF